MVRNIYMIESHNEYCAIIVLPAILHFYAQLLQYSILVMIRTSSARIRNYTREKHSLVNLIHDNLNDDPLRATYGIHLAKDVFKYRVRRAVSTFLFVIQTLFNLQTNSCLRCWLPEAITVLAKNFKCSW